MRPIPFLAIALGTLLLAGCGGGGGSSTDTPVALAPTVTINSSNQNTVARATLDGGQALGTSQALDTSDRASAEAANATPALVRGSAIQMAVQRAVHAGFTPQRNAAILSAAKPAATTTQTYTCASGGNFSVSVNDADNNNALTAGDSLTITFNQCRESATESMNGAMVFTINSVAAATSTNTQFSATLAFQHVTVVVGQYTAGINGSVTVSANITSTTSQLTIAIGSDGLVATSAGGGYSDSITYDPGMQIAMSSSSTSSSVSLNGSFSATSLGGRVSVQTTAPIVQAAADLYPSSGQVIVTGVSGSKLRMTALSNTQLRLELDSNGDGTYENTATVAWGSLRPA
jgi:hypothetical protein